MIINENGGPANQPPIAEGRPFFMCGQSVYTAVDSTIEIILTASDPDGDPLAYVIETLGGAERGSLERCAAPATKLLRFIHATAGAGRPAEEHGRD